MYETILSVNLMILLFYSFRRLATLTFGAIPTRLVIEKQKEKGAAASLVGGAAGGAMD